MAPPYPLGYGWALDRAIRVDSWTPASPSLPVSRVAMPATSIRAALLRRGADQDPAKGLTHLAGIQLPTSVEARLLEESAAPAERQRLVDRAAWDAFPYKRLRQLLDAAEWPSEWAAEAPTPFPGCLDQPKDSDLGRMGWGHRLQGVTHSDTHWYFSTVTTEFAGLRGWLASNSFVFEVAMADGVMSAGGHSRRARLPEQDEEGKPLAGAYRHFGDLDFSRGYLFVPLEADDLGKGGSPTILVFDTRGDAITFVRSQALPGRAGLPWCAVHPLTGHLYTSEFAATELAIFRIRWERLIPGNTEPFLEAVGRQPLVGVDAFLPAVQGGAFTSRGHLYLSVDKGYGVRGWDLTTSRLAAHFGVQYDLDKGEELEGITVWDLEFGPSGRQQIHVIMLNEYVGDGDGTGVADLYFKHYGVLAGDVAKV